MPLALKEIQPVSHASERHLVRAVREGDDRAFEQLFSRYRRRITAYVYGLLGDHGRAEDITQEVFISALRRLRETEGSISFKPWIYEIARNACIDEFRRVNRASIVSLDLDTDPDGSPPLQLADDMTPEVRWERKQQIGDLFGAFSSLPDNQHQILILRELEGLSYGEIGSRMGMSRPMVESTLFRARRRLTQEYDELASGRRCLDVQGAVDRQDVQGITSLGLRERRRIARHLHHCQDCLRYARMAGIDDSALRVPGPARRVAALLPFGWLRLARDRVTPSGRGAARTAHRSSGLAQGTPQAFAVGKAAAAAAALLITGGSVTAIVHAAGSAHHPVAAPAAVPAREAVGLMGPPFGSAGATTSRSGAVAGRQDGAPAAPGRLPAGSGSRGSGSPGAGTPAVARPGTIPSTRPTGPSATSVLGRLPLPVQTPLSTIIAKGTATTGRVVSTIPRTLSGVTNTVGGVVSTAPKTAGGVVSTAPGTVGSVVSTAPGTVGGVVSTAPGTVGGVASTAPGTVGGVVNKAPGGLSEIAPTALTAPTAPAPVGGAATTSQLGSAGASAAKAPASLAGVVSTPPAASGAHTVSGTGVAPGTLKHGSRLP